MFNSSHEEDIASSYPDVRIMTVKKTSSDVPLNDVQMAQNWTRPSKG